MNPHKRGREVWLGNVVASDNEAIEAIKRQWRSVRFDVGYNKGETVPNPDVMSVLVDGLEVGSRIGERGLDAANKKDAIHHAAFAEKA